MFERLLLYGLVAVWLGGLIVRPFGCIFESRLIEKPNICTSIDGTQFSLVLALLWFVTGLIIARMYSSLCKNKPV